MIKDDERYSKFQPGKGSLKELEAMHEEIHKDLVKHVGVSCWHMSTCESAAMWSLYSKTNEGIAIRSTVGRLLEQVDRNTNVYIKIGKVIYRF